MSAQGVKKVIERIAADLHALAVTVLEDDSIATNEKVGRNTLAHSKLKDDLAMRIQQSGDPVIAALFNNYVVYLEWTRPPRYGKRPPISALKDWAQRNGIPTDSHTLYAISYAIWRDGHKGRPIFATMDRINDQLFAEDWAPALRDALFDELDLIFND